MKVLRIASVVAALGFLAVGKPSWAQTVVARVTQAPTIDGHLDDPVWKSATKITDFVVLGTGTPPEQPTEAWLATDGRFLYIAVRCHELNLRDLVHKTVLRDGVVHADDSIEIFLDPGTAGALYFHFQLNCANVQADQIMWRGLPDREWNAAWQSATFFDPLLPENGWTAEIALPLYLFRSKAGREPWRLNLCRNKRTQPSAFVTWGRLAGGFHDPGNFPVVAGLSDAPPADLFAPILHSAAVTRYRVRDGRYGYEVRGEILNDGGRKGQVEIVTTDQPVEGTAGEAKIELTLSPLERRTFVVPVAIERPGERRIRVGLRQTATGETPQQLEVETDPLNPLDAYLDRNYYTVESEARVLAVAGMDEAEVRAAGLRLSASLLDPQGKVLSAREATAGAGETAIAFPLKDVPTGETGVRVQLRDRAGAVLGNRILILRKLPPAPAGVAEVKIDRENRCLLVNGKPFFPIGICAGHLEDDWLKVYRNCGFNTLIRWAGSGRNSPVADALAALDRVHRHGMYLIEKPLTFLKTDFKRQGLLRPEGMSLAAEEMRDFLKAARSHPAVLAYYGLDEAPDRGWDRGLQRFLDVAHEEDPYHPVYISGSGPSRLNRYDFADIIGRHAYWCPMGASPLDNPNRIARVVKWNVENINEPNRSPFFFIPQAEITSHSRRSLTPTERRVTVYLALIHGAKSMIYFVSPIRHRATADNMKELSAEMQALAPSLLRRRPVQEIAVTPSPAGEDLPVVQAAVADRPEGGTLLLAANSSTSPVDAAWDLSAFGSGARVSDFFTKKRFPVEKSMLQDRFDGYATRVYLIEGGSRKSGEKAVVRLALSGPAVQAVAPKEPRTKNLVSDPGFETDAGVWRIDGKGGSFVQEGPDGSRCLKIVKTEPAAGVNIVCTKTFPLKPNTRYRFGGDFKSVLEQGRVAARIYLYEAGWRQLPKDVKPRLAARTLAQPTAGEWKRVVREITTPDIGEFQGDIWLQIPYLVGEIWMDNVFVEEVPVEKPRKRKNMILNSSFEEATLPGWPDSWWFGYPGPDRMAGDPGGPGQDGSTAYHGKYSLRLYNPYDFPSGFPSAIYRHEFGSTNLRGGIPIEPGKKYVFSAYMKAEQDGTVVEMQVCNFAGVSWVYEEGELKSFKLTTDWKRYEVVCEYPKEGWTRSIRPALGVIIWHRRGVKNSVWIDAVQLEEGEKATDYVAE